MDIIYQWDPWAYSHEASQNFADDVGVNWNFRNVSTFEDIFNEIKMWVVERLPIVWILPIENGYEGSVHENFKRLLDFWKDFQIIAEILLEVKHCLLGKTSNLDDIKKVYSHPQALWQCREYLKRNNLNSLNYNNTASAAKMVAESDDLAIASVSSKFCAKLYWLNVLAENIQDMSWNITRFFVITAKNVFDEYLKELNIHKSNKISVKFETYNKPWALVDCLLIFRHKEINITKIESFPTRKENFKYVFWLDIERKGVSDGTINNALNELKKVWREVMVLGDY
jgi:prephenate dehydratase